MGPPAGGEACGAGRLPEGTTGPRAGAVPSAKALSQEDDADREVTGLPSWEGATRKLAAELQMLRASRTQGAQPAGEDCQATTGVGPGGKAAAEKMQGADAGEVQEEKSAGEATQNVSDFSEGKEPGSPPEDSSADSRGPPVGCLTVRSISQLTEVYDVPGARPPGPVGAQRHGLANASERRPQSGCRRYFLLDDGFQCGRVLLVYPPTADKTVASQPRVFLQVGAGLAAPLRLLNEILTRRLSYTGNLQGPLGAPTSSDFFKVRRSLSRLTASRAALPAPVAPR
eukprot:GHVT01078910.1.p1 GENE.GHVT01078910.1~~GHVT01078910.1.p1  ORF type:complete len:285 (-),score=78.78 GHVT01078910.1:66-920(-)